MEKYFPDIETVTYDGPNSDDALSFQYYDVDREIGGQTM
jgi:xylose isomerase